MAYATGTRLAAFFFSITGIGLPIGIWLWLKAREKEKEAEKRQEMMENMAEHHPKE